MEECFLIDRFETKGSQRFLQIMGMIVAMKAAEAGNFLDAFTSGYDQRKMGIIMIIAKILPIIVLSALKVRSSEQWKRNDTL